MIVGRGKPSMPPERARQSDGALTQSSSKTTLRGTRSDFFTMAPASGIGGPYGRRERAGVDWPDPACGARRLPQTAVRRFGRLAPPATNDPTTIRPRVGG